MDWGIPSVLCQAVSGPAKPCEAPALDIISEDAVGVPPKKEDLKKLILKRVSTFYVREV